MSSEKEVLKSLDLFAGCGGFTSAGERTRGKVVTAQFVEIDPDAIAVLEDHWPEIPIHKDAKTFHCQKGEFDLITAGFPCTGTSTAGTRTGLEHPESALFREALRIICECQPKFSIIEQPVGIIDRGLRAILGGLQLAGYQSEVEIISASELGAGHRRERLFIISYPYGQFRHIPRGWNEQIRELVEKQRANSQWLTVKRDRLCPDSGFSFQLVQGTNKRPLTVDSLTCPTRTPGRIRAKKLAGRTVTPSQAAIAIERVLYLNSLL
ncbi:MAG: DNA cytosine methyltransferase [Snowella sp.]|nr:DNA cytosine methyltransferase [Snowella sp.]